MGPFRRLLVFAFLFAPLGCSDPLSPLAEEEIVVLGSRGDCIDRTQQPLPCFLATKVPSGDTTAFADHDIIGFTFEPEVRQHILISSRRIPNPPADGSDTEYRLLRVISRTPLEATP